MKKDEANLTAIAFVIGAFGLLLVFMYLFEDFRIAIPATFILTGAAAYAVYHIIDRRNKTRIRNRHQNYHVAGCCPWDMTIEGKKVEEGSIPFMRDFAEYVEFVPHKDVHTRKAEIEAEIEAAYKGIAEEDRHPIKVFTYTFRLPVDDNAVVERWEHQSGEGFDNSYPARIMRGVEADLKKTEVAQFNTNAEEYCKIVLGQNIPASSGKSRVIEW